MITRREWLRLTAGVGTGMAFGLNPRTLLAARRDPLMTRAIPSTGVEIPVIGLGGRWISMNSSEEELADHRAVLHALAADAEGAGRMFDSAAGYGGGASEDLSGQWANEDGFADGIFPYGRLDGADSDFFHGFVVFVCHNEPPW